MFPRHRLRNLSRDGSTHAGNTQEAAIVLFHNSFCNPRFSGVAAGRPAGTRVSLLALIIADNSLYTVATVGYVS